MTRYYAPQGELHSFERGGSTYQVHSDALGSVRAITDSNGSVVAHYEYEAWGGLLASSSDLSGGFAYRFVGGLGVRFDPTTGLYYCRQRWLDLGLARFISRDPESTGSGQVSSHSAPNGHELFGSEHSFAPLKPQNGEVPFTRNGWERMGVSELAPVQVDNCYNYAGNRPVDLIDPTGRQPQETFPATICMADQITKKACREACEVAFTSKRDLALCLQICDTLRGNTCNSLFAYCNHLARHPSELGRRAAENCMSLYNTLCAGK